MHFIAFVSPVQQVLPSALGANGEADIRWGTQKYSFSISCPKQLVRGIWIKTQKSKEQMQTTRNADVCTYMEKGFFCRNSLYCLVITHNCLICCTEQRKQNQNPEENYSLTVEGKRKRSVKKRDS